VSFNTPGWQQNGGENEGGGHFGGEIGLLLRQGKKEGVQTGDGEYGGRMHAPHKRQNCLGIYWGVRKLGTKTAEIALGH